MIPSGPSPKQRRQETRLAWIIIGCSAMATLVLVAIGIWALGGSIARGVENLAATNSSAPAPDRSDVADTAGGETDDRDAAALDDSLADRAPADRELRKRSADEQRVEEGDEATVRRGNGPRERDAPPPSRRAGPVA